MTLKTLILSRKIPTQGNYVYLQTPKCLLPDIKWASEGRFLGVFGPDTREFEFKNISSKELTFNRYLQYSLKEVEAYSDIKLTVNPKKLKPSSTSMNASIEFRDSRDSKVWQEARTVAIPICKLN